jgi:hypothetical protein
MAMPVCASPAPVSSSPSFWPQRWPAPEGTLIEVMLDPEVITTRGTLSAITRHALNK